MANLKLTNMDTPTVLPALPQVRTNQNAKYFQDPGELNALPSMTVPDQSLSVREILQRHASGYPMTVAVPFFNGEDGEYIDPRTLDISERVELAAALSLEIKELNAAYGRKNQNTGEVISPAQLPEIPVNDQGEPQLSKE